MTTLNLLLLATLTIFSYSTTPSSADLSKNGIHYNHICDPLRYASLGLNMADFKFCHKSLPYDVRVKNLVDSMSIAEKVKQLGNKAAGVPRLGLPSYDWWSEALHGVADTGPGTHFDKNAGIPGATSFPEVINAGATFNETLWKKTGQVVSTEARAMYNVGLAGLTFWSPNINVARDPRWGRTLETPGEDPFLVGSYGVNYVRGLQDVEGYENTGDLNTRPLKVAACCKHYAAYDLENWFGIDRWHFDARVTEQDMVETFLRPFEMCVKEGDVSSVMCSFNMVNGIPTCADPRLLGQTIRDAWDLHGYIVSDCDSIQTIRESQKWLNFTKEEAVAQVLRAGLDLDCGEYYPDYTLPAIQQGKVRERDVDKALYNLYMVLMRLGYFDDIPAYSSLGPKDVCTDEHIELAADSARQSIVLLKNENNTLPLNENAYVNKTVAVVGPHVYSHWYMLGNYYGTPCRFVSAEQGISMYVNTIIKRGCHDCACTEKDWFPGAIEAARTADATILVVGLDPHFEAEGIDRTDFLLPGYQTQLINEVADASPTPVIMVILSAGGLDISFAKNNPKIGAILWAGYPGEEGGRAIADVIFGKYNPGGRLPLTWYPEDYVDKLPLSSMPMRPVKALGYPGRTYKFYNGSTVYPFGYGLSYTQFTTTIVSATTRFAPVLSLVIHCHFIESTQRPYPGLCWSINVQDIKCNDTIDIEMDVSNIGRRSGSHVVLVYLKPPSEVIGFPTKKLVGFKRVFVDAGKSERVKFSLNACTALSFVDALGYTLIPSGKHTIMVGNEDEAVSFIFHVDLDHPN